jgi:hypothetical protein
MPNKRESRVNVWLTPDKLMLLEAWARDGYKKEDFLKRMGITSPTFYRWLKKYPQMRKAIYRGKEIIDYQVENALLKSALGYTTRETKIIRSNKPDRNGNFEIRTEITEKEIAPNTTAIAIWLNNRKPEQWKRNRDNVLELKDDETNITVNIIKARENKNTNKSESNEEEDESWNDENIIDNLESNSEVKEQNNSQYELYEDVIDFFELEENEEKEIKETPDNKNQNIYQKSSIKSTIKNKKKSKVEYTDEELEWLGEDE